nr:immunoglobulin light chain junction region [Macaca mulatta]MOW41748.1 immunoglobulin light chain junction region [Macaca mulatta]
CQQYNSDPHTF